jgi:hypothetical protein
VYDAIAIEEMGKPAAALVNRGFVNDAASAASSKGRPGLRFISESVPNEVSVAEQAEVGVRDAMDDIVAALTRPLTTEERRPEPPKIEKPSRVAFKGNLKEVNLFFYNRGWTDGFPVMPPTEEEVAEMLTGTDLPRDRVVGTILPRLGKATVEKIAVNAVMAGALPTYMSLLIAGVQALADPETGFGGWGVSTGSWAPFWVINGPIRNQLRINSGSGAFSPGDIANAAIGRAMGLIIKNIGGIRKGMEDMGVMGNPGKYTWVVAENEEESPWEPLHVEHGFKKEESTITVSSPNSFWQIMPYGTDDQGVLKAVVYNLLSARAGRGTFWLVLTPLQAGFLAKWTKKDISKFIYEHAHTPVYRVPQFYGNYPDKPPIKGMLMNQSDTIPILAGPDGMRIIVAGGSGMFMGILSPAGVGRPPVTKKVELPQNWESLVEKYKNVAPVYTRY